MKHLMDTKSHNWREAGLARQISARAVKRARLEFVVLFPALAGVLLVYGYRRELFGPDFDIPVRIGTVVALMILGWALARDVGRALGPYLFRRLDPGTAGTIGFLLRLVTVIIALLVALRVAGLAPQTVALGGALTAVVLGLAAQQTLGNLFAGTVLLSARPFRVGERVSLQGGGIEVEGVVSSLGLLYTTFASGDDAIMVPNSVVLGQAVTPLHEPAGVDLRARLRPGVTPIDVHNLLAGQRADADPRRAARHAGGDGRRRDRGPHRRDARARRRRAEARGRGPVRRRTRDPQGRDAAAGLSATACPPGPRPCGRRCARRPACSTPSTRGPARRPQARCRSAAPAARR